MIAGEAHHARRKDFLDMARYRHKSVQGLLDDRQPYNDGAIVGAQIQNPLHKSNDEVEFKT